MSAARRPARPMVPPIVRSTTYDLDDTGLADIESTGGRGIWWYSRLGNPTVEGLAASVAALEGAEHAVAFSSGMAAITATLTALAPPGAHIVAARELYGETYRMLRDHLAAEGRTVTYVAIDDLPGFAQAL
jgi:O-acetylhomoserine/O-acetylserine sulfhydrylase-like pyridoxal-dependent enzyme